MMAGKRGYRNIQSFSNDQEMLHDYFGVIARGDRFFLSHYINVNEGKNVLYELTEEEKEEILADYEKYGWSIFFIEKWVWKVS